MLLLRAQAGGPWTLQGGSGSGFTCVAAGVNLECRGNALAAGQTVELRLQGTVNATASSALSALLDVSAATADPVAGNNSANVTVPQTWRSARPTASIRWPSASASATP
jgi:hypothetical protein